MKHNILSLDFWQDTAIYGGKSFPSGTLGCDALSMRYPSFELSEGEAAERNRDFI